MSLSDVVNIILSIMSFLLAAISVITVIITLRQNNKMLEAEAKPYVVPYLVYDEYSDHLILCVKNFGKSSAIINILSISPGFKIHKRSCNDILHNTVIAPAQQFHFIIRPDEKDRIIQENAFTHDVKTSYTDCVTGKQYMEEFVINIEYCTEVVSSRFRKSNMDEMSNSIRNIESAIQLMKHRNL